MKVIEKVERTFWEDVARNCAYATFFHTPYWSELMSKTFSYIDVTKGFVFDDGTKVIFPFMRRKRRRLKGLLHLYDYVSGPPYMYGGPISDGELNKQQLHEIIEYINSTFEMHDIVLIRGNPFGPNIKPTGFQEVKDFSHVVELFKYRDERDLLKSYEWRSSGRCIQSAKESNVLIIKEGTALNEYETLYQIYKGSFKHWDKVITDYPQILFQNLFNLKNKYIKLWTVYYKNNMIGGMITLLWNNYCTGFISYHDRKYSKLHGNRYIFHNCFLDCIEKGFRYYDFMQSGGIKGVEDFKKSMLGKEYPHTAWLKKNKFLGKMRRIKTSINSIYKKGK